VSFSFYIESKSKLKYQQLMQIDHLSCFEPPAAAEKHLTGVRHFFIPNVSCRGSEVAVEEDGYSVRVLACSAPEDYELSLTLVETIAKSTNGKISGECGSKVTVKQLRSKFDSEWINNDLNLSFAAVESSAAGLTNGQYLSLSGAVRDFYVGPRMLQELSKLGSVESMRNEFFEKFRAVQYIDPELYYFPSIRVFPKSSKKFVVWGPGCQYFFPAIQVFALVSLEDGVPPLFVDSDCLQELAGERISWLDEKQALVSSVAESDWPDFLLRARKFEIDPATL
jgi:hypothetical protein